MRTGKKLIDAAAQTLAADLSSPADTAHSKWVLFESSAGFAVRYPAAWTRKDIGKERLLLLSSAGGAGEAVIRPGQALLSVYEAIGRRKCARPEPPPQRPEPPADSS